MIAIFLYFQPYALICQVLGSEIKVSNKPANLTIGNVTNTTIALSWNKPERPSGDILGYQVFYEYEVNNPASKSVNVTYAKVHYTLSNLKPFTEYKIWVDSVMMGDGDNDNDRSETLKQYTDVSGPGPPRITNVTCLHNSIFIQWQRPIEFFNTIDLYTIYYKSTNNDKYNEIKVNSSSSNDVLNQIVDNLTDNTEYEIRVSGASSSFLKPNKFMEGVCSEPKRIKIKPDCDQPDLFEGTNKYLNVVLIIVIVFASFAIFLTICVVAIWR